MSPPAQLWKDTRVLLYILSRHTGGLQTTLLGLEVRIYTSISYFFTPACMYGQDVPTCGCYTRFPPALSSPPGTERWIRGGSKHLCQCIRLALGWYQCTVQTHTYIWVITDQGFLKNALFWPAKQHKDQPKAATHFSVQNPCNWHQISHGRNRKKEDSCHLISHCEITESQKPRLINCRVPNIYQQIQALYMFLSGSGG